MSLSSDLQNVIDIVTKPQKAIGYLRDTPSLLVPMLLVPLATACWFVVFQSVNANLVAESVVSEMTAQSPPEISAEELTSIVSVLMRVLGPIWAAIAVYLSMLIVAGYLRVVTPDKETSTSFREWLSLTAWAQIPYVLSAILGIAFMVFFASEATGLDDLNPFALAFYLNGSSSGFAISFLSQIDLFVLWMLGILAVGYSKWTEKNIWLSVLIVSIPYLAWWILFSMINWT